MLITSLIISYFFFSSSLSGVVRRLNEKLILWSSQSSFISPWSSRDTFIVLSFLLILNEHGLQEHLMPLGLISISFLNCIFPLHSGQSIIINLLVNLCSLVSVIVLGSSSLKTSSSGMGFYCFFLVAFIFTFR